MTDLRRIDPYLIKLFGECKNGPGKDEVRFNCPECINHGHTPDIGFHLYVNLQKGKFNCIRCGKPSNPKGFFGNLKKLYGKDYEPAVDWKKWQTIRARLTGEAVDVEPMVRDINEYLGWYTKPLEAYSDASAYLQERTATIPRREMKTVWSKVFRQGKGKHFDRLFLLDWYAGQPRYWNARAIYPGEAKRYLNPPLPRFSLLFNQLHVEKVGPQEIIINEGILSSIHAGTNSVASYGRILTVAQLHILNRMRCKRFYQVVESDPDAQSDGWRNAALLHALGREVFLIPMPEKQDPASLGRNGFLTLLADSAIAYSLKNRVHSSMRR
jgi:hypothetical protein